MKGSASGEVEMHDKYDDRESKFGMSMSTMDMCSTQLSSSSPKAESTGFGINKQQQFGDAEEGRGMTFANNPSLARQDANAKDAEEDAQAHSDLRVVNIFNLVFFGSGTRLWIPITWAVVNVIAVSFQNIIWKCWCRPDISIYICASRSSYTSFVLLFEIMGVSVMASLYFGWGMVQSNYIENLIRENCHTAVARHKSRKMLGRIATAIMIMTIVICIAEVAPTLKTQESVPPFYSKLLGVNTVTIPTIGIIVTQLQTFLFFGVTYYTVSIWLWTCWVKVQVNESLAETISLESISDGSFIDAFFDACESNSMTSSLWKTSHIERVFTCVPIAWIQVYTGHSTVTEAEQSGDYQFAALGVMFICLGYLLYATVWLSIVGAGYVNDNGYSRCARAVSALKYQDDDAMSAADNLTHRRYFEGHRMNALLRMGVIQNTSGFTFAGALVSAQKAFAVGSVLVAIMNLKA